MPGAPILSCRQCGTVLSAAGGRCPTCGAEQPADAPRGLPTPVGTAMLAPSLRAGRHIASPETSARKKALPWVVLGVGMVAIGGLVALMPRHADTTPAAPSITPVPAATPSEARSADPNDFGIADPGAVDPMEILGRAKTRAVAWSKDAELASIHAEPVVNGKVNLSGGGSIEFWFGKPTGEARMARVSGKRLHLTLTASGTQASEVSAGPGRAALEPSCPLDEAIRKASAVGVPAGAPLSVSYEVSEKYQKAVWRIAAPGAGTAPRTVDGYTCAILVR